MKPIQLNEEQIKALLDGGSMLVMPITKNLQELKPTIRQIKSFISMFSPLQTGEEYFVQEEWETTIANKSYLYEDIKYQIVYKVDNKTLCKTWQDASQMQEHQSRLKFKVIEVGVKDNNFNVKVEVIK